MKEGVDSVIAGVLSADKFSGVVWGMNMWENARGKLAIGNSN